LQQLAISATYALHFCLSLLPSHGVNFINILRAAFARKNPKSEKKSDNLTVFFALLGRKLMKLAHGDKDGKEKQEKEKSELTKNANR